MSSILDRIFAAKRAELETARREATIGAIEKAAAGAPHPRSMLAALGSRRPAIIAEIKRASPSKGDILPGLDPATVAREYASAGAAAISVLTDVHFKGALADLRAVRAAADLPVLRKDFIFDPYQVFEARAAGADCILLITAMLDRGRLNELSSLSRDLGMASLIEVHNRKEFEAAQEIEAGLIGINNRDLHSFHTDIAVTESLLVHYSGSASIVAESGIETSSDLRRLDRAGARAFLIGEGLLRGGKPARKLSELIAGFSVHAAAGDRTDNH